MPAGIRAIAAVVAFYASVAVLSAPILFLAPEDWTRGVAGLYLTSGTLAVTASLVYAGLVLLGWSDCRELRLPRARTAVWGGGVGVAVGLVMALIAVALALGVGGAKLVLTGEPLGAYAAAALRLSALLALAALSEELLFRGYPLARLGASIGRIPASIGLAVVFALVHVWNPEASLLGAVNIGLAALALSAGFFSRGGLPLAWGLHFGWNAGLSLSADAPVSGLDFDLPLVEFIAEGPSWIAGGAFGPEGGLVASVVMGVAIVGLVFWDVRSREERTS